VNPDIRVMSRADLDLAVDWAAAEGWNPGLEDAACFLAADPEGFLMAFQGDEPVASISVVRYDSHFAFLGFYIVPPAFRGRRFGLSIWRAGMARGEGLVVGLDGVVAQQANYARSGFVLAHRQIRFGGQAEIDAPADARLHTITQDVLPAVIAYDRGVFAAPREGFLRSWLDPHRHRTVALVEDGRVAGYGVLRRCRTGHKIGPLFADNETHADMLFRALAAHSRGAPVFLDVPEPNGRALALAERYGLSPSFETARMYRGAPPAARVVNTFGVTSFELG
jgi:hypothetical protein